MHPISETTTKVKLDINEAESNLEKFFQLQSQKAAIDASMRAYKEKLKEFADNNRDLLDDKSNLNLSAGYLHYGKKTVVKFPKSFSIVSFVKKFPALIKWEFKTSPVKAFFQEEKSKAKIKAFGLKLVEEDTFEIIAAKDEQPN